MNKIYILLATILLGTATVTQAQEPVQAKSSSASSSQAWEIGLGGTLFQTSRYSVLQFGETPEKGYNLKTSKRDILWGAHLYLARELHPNWAIDLQGNFGYANDPVTTQKTKPHWLAMGTLGLQWRLGNYFDSKFIDPFVRIGAGYLYKNYEIQYRGTSSIEGLTENNEMKWTFTNDNNKSGADHKGLVPVALGLGVNMWLNSNIGLGLQGDYLYIPYKNVANIPQVTARLMWRIGGEPKQGPATVQYIEKIVEKPTVVEKIVEKIVEKPTVVEKVVEKRVEVPAKGNITNVQQILCDLFQVIYFDFDDSKLEEVAGDVLDRIAEIIRQHPNRKYLIVGFTDARGSDEYNKRLGLERAQVVMKALIGRGLDASLFKAKSAGKSAAFAAPSESDKARSGDRKVVVEVITNMEYWNTL